MSENISGSETLGISPEKLSEKIAEMRKFGAERLLQLSGVELDD